jgi:hypothetical protein
MTHHVIDIEIISNLPGEVLTTQEKCSRHPDAVFNVKWTWVMPSEILWKSGDVFALLDAISSGMTLSHERWSSDMQLRQQITSCWLQKKSIRKLGCLEHFVCVVSTSSGNVDITSMSVT